MEELPGLIEKELLFYERNRDLILTLYDHCPSWPAKAMDRSLMVGAKGDGQGDIGPRYAQRFIVGGSFTIKMYWLKQDPRIPAREMADLVCHLMGSNWDIG